MHAPNFTRMPRRRPPQAPLRCDVAYMALRYLSGAITRPNSHRCASSCKRLAFMKTEAPGRAPLRTTLLMLLVIPHLACAAGKITLGMVNWIGYGPIYCAVTNGFYKRRGADVRLVTFSDNSLMPGALQGGELDASTLTYDQVIAAAAKG